MLFKKNIDVKNIDSGERSSFEFSEWRVIFVIVYRPPYSRTFFEEFSSYLESIILSPESLLLTDDFNFHVDVASDPDARVFLDLLTSMGLKQHVTITAHVSEHTLDLLITREHDSVI